MNQLILIGASGHGRVVADIARLCGYERIAYLDDNRKLQGCGPYPVIGTAVDFQRFADSGTDFFVAVGNASVRQKIQKEIERAGGTIVSLIHPNAVIPEDIEIGNGTVLMAGTVINSGTTIGKGCILNTSSSVDHDCIIGNFVHIAVGVHLSGTVKVGDNTWIGAGATVSNNVNICGHCMIGAGAVVVKDIGEAGIYVGVPAKLLKKGSEEMEFAAWGGGNSS